MIQPQPLWITPSQTRRLHRLHGMRSLALESIAVITCLTLSLVTQPYHLRTTLWAAGAQHGWNSDPHERVYFYANYKPPPPVPFIWSEECGCPNAVLSAQDKSNTQRLTLAVSRGRTWQSLPSALASVLAGGSWTFTTFNSVASTCCTIC